MSQDPQQPEHLESPGTPEAGADGPTIHFEGVIEPIDLRVEELIEANASPQELAVQVAEQEPPDAADTLERLEPEESVEVIREMEDQAAAEALAHMVTPLAASAILDLDRAEAARILGYMDDDDAADLLQSMSKADAADLASRLHPRKAAAIGKLVLYDPQTAGGLMTTDIRVVRDSLTIGQATERIKRRTLNPMQHDIYVVDSDRRLVGTIDLYTLIVTDDSELLADHVERDIDAVHPELDQEEVARLFDRYDLLTLPVVDEDRRVLGMVTIDDVVDIIEAERTEDVMKQVGAGAEEAVYSTLKDKLKGRFPWLLANLLLASIGSAVILVFADLIEVIPAVAIVFPIIANQAGNTGHQSLAVTLRGLVLEEIHAERVFPLLRREMLFGLITGIGVGTVFALAIAGLGSLGVGSSDGLDWRLGIIAGIAMVGALYASCLVGTATPLLMERFGADPATASSIFVTMFTDAISYFTFLLLVFLLRNWLQAGMEPDQGMALALAC